MLRLLGCSLPGLLLLAATANAQPVSFGVKAGVALRDAVEGSLNVVRDQSRPFVVGPMVEIALPANPAVEVNALYRRTGNDSADSTFPNTRVTLVRGNAWEFPMLAKWCVAGRDRVAQPYVCGGYVLRSLSGVSGTGFVSGRNPVTGELVEDRFPLPQPLLVRNNPTHGFAAAGSVRIKALFLNSRPKSATPGGANGPSISKGREASS